MSQAYAAAGAGRRRVEGCPNRRSPCVVVVWAAYRAASTKLGGVMPEYLLLLYADEAGPEEQAERERELPVWLELNESLLEAGLLVASDRLHAADSATTVRVRHGGAEITDGPF